jgi:hypothetical protein
MATLDQLPGELNITVKQGDDLSFDCRFNVDMTGYTLSAYITPAGTSPTNIPITITNTDLINGVIHLFISRASIANLPLNTNSNTWMFEWTVSGFKRAILGGTFRVEES